MVERSRRSSLEGDVILAVGAHPDDIELGCGGSLAYHNSIGDKVICVYLTYGEKMGDKEVRAAETRHHNRELKVLMDRTRYLHVGCQLRGKVGGAIAVTGSTGVEDTLSAINAFFLQHRMILGHPGAFAILGETEDVRNNKAAIRGARELGQTVGLLMRQRVAHDAPKIFL